jgi:hypothetical protein
MQIDLIPLFCTCFFVRQHGKSEEGLPNKQQSIQVNEDVLFTRLDYVVFLRVKDVIFKSRRFESWLERPL